MAEKLRQGKTVTEQISVGKNVSEKTISEKAILETNYLRKKCFEKNHLNFVATLIVLTMNAVLLTVVAVFLQQILDIAVNGTVKDIEKMMVVAFIYVLVLVLEGLTDVPSGTVLWKKVCDS